MIYFIYFSLLISFNAHSSSHELLVCLGKEEKKFHKNKKLNPYYLINQKMMEETIQLPKLQLNRKYYEIICGPQVKRPSFELLYHGLKHANEIFEFDSRLTANETALRRSLVSEWQEALREVFLQFLSHAQEQAPDPNCLSRALPQVNKFLNRIKDLQEDVDLKDIFNPEQIGSWFIKLRNIERIYQDCESFIRKTKKSN